MENVEREERILILAPVGRDADLARQTLMRVGLRADVCADMESLRRELDAGAGTSLLTQEALAGAALATLVTALDSQPPWSDLPLIVLVSRDPPASIHLSERFGRRANATFLERPAAAATLVQAVQVALRARRRQYELRDHLLALARAREAEQHARAVAEEAVRIRDEFLASVAHDLKNPLGSIKGFAQLLQRRIQRGLVDHDALVDQLGRIDGMASRAVGQIDELLDAARLQAGQPLPLTLTPVDLVALARRVAADCQAAAGDRRIEVDTDTDELLGVWDQPRLERVLANLVGNAIKYSPEGGDVVVRVRSDDDRVVLTVEDHGIGIPPRDLPNVFERFYRASNAATMAGTGLGLAGVRQIVEQHGGAIGIESEEGKGTRVTVRLPLVQEDVHGHTAAAGE